MKKIIILFIISALLSGCAGKFEYTRPSGKPILSNSIVFNMGKDKLWRQFVPELGKQFFIINNLDKDSGIINLSYGGDPQKYVDCGYINSYVKNARGERTYYFPASKAFQEYEIMKNGLYFVSRKMNLEGRINIIVEEIGSNKSRVTVNIKYIVTKNVSISDVNRRLLSTLTDTISFNSGQESSFPGTQLTTCQANGELENEILSLLKN